MCAWVACFKRTLPLAKAQRFSNEFSISKEDSWVKDRQPIVRSFPEVATFTSGYKDKCADESQIQK